MDDNKTFVVYGAVTAVLLLLGVGIWMIGKKINYKLQYEQMVRDTITEMVKPEALNKK